MGTIGGFDAELGPFVIGDAALRRSFQRKLTRDEAVEFVRVKDTVRVTSLAGQPALVLRRGSATDVAKLDARSAVFVRFVKRGDARLSSLDEVSPWWVDDDAWTRCDQLFSVRGELQAFDTMAQVLAKSEPGEEEDYGEGTRGDEYLSVTLEPGEYLVEWAKLTVPTRDELWFVRLRQAGHEPVRPAQVIPIPQVNQLECDAATIELAKSVKFIGHGDGGPTIILPNAVRDRWKGVAGGDEGGEGTHYDLACRSEETLEFEGLHAFCLQEVGATGVLPVKEGVLLPRWVGADSKAGVLAAALQVEYQPVLKNGQPLLFESQGGRFTLMHSVDGGAPETWDWESTEFEIPAGKYAVEQMDVDGGIEWRGLVMFPDGKTEDSMIQAYRLRLL